MRPRMRVIYNPYAGRETFRQHLPRVLQILEEAGFEASSHATKGAGDATAEAERAARDGFCHVVACGGDGTVNEVINGLARTPESMRPVLGVIPAGTTNDLARALKIPFQIEQAARMIAQQKRMPLDLGLVGTDRYFVNIAACGRLAEITYEVPSRMKTVLGQFAYVMRGIERLPGLRPIPLHVEADERVYDGEAMLCLVTNSRSVGGFERLAPYASVNDGLLDVMIVKPMNLGEMIRVLGLALRGEHVGDARIEYFRARAIALSSTEEVDLNVDGEYGGKLPFSVRVLPRHLTVVAGL